MRFDPALVRLEHGLGGLAAGKYVSIWISSAVTSSGVPIDVSIVNSRTSSDGERRCTVTNGAASRPGAGTRHSDGTLGWASTRASRRVSSSSPGRAAISRCRRATRYAATSVPLTRYGWSAPACTVPSTRLRAVVLWGLPTTSLFNE